MLHTWWRCRLLLLVQVEKLFKTFYSIEIQPTLVSINLSRSLSSPPSGRFWLPPNRVVEGKIVILKVSTYSKVPNKRSATFIKFRQIFQGLRSYLEGVRLLVLTECFLQVRKVGFKIPNSMKIIFIEESITLFCGGMLIVSAQFSRGYVYLGTYAC